MPMITCTVAGCNSHAITRTWCKMHYQRWLRHGNPLGPKPELDPGFWDEVNIYYYERLKYRSAQHSPTRGTLSAGVRI